MSVGLGGGPWRDSHRDLNRLDGRVAALGQHACDVRVGDDAEQLAGRIDNDLHGYLVERADNRYIRSFFDANGRYFNALFDYAGLGPSVLREMARQHVAILEAALHRRWARASEALALHIRAQKPVMERLLDRLDA